MMKHKREIQEAEWWEEFGHLADRVWRFDDSLNTAIRREYLTEMHNFLFQPGGRLLDFGCGAGWFSLPLAQRGMVVDGVDSCAMHVRRATQQAQAQGLANARFWCADRLSQAQRGAYDAALLHAVVHHIPTGRRRALLSDIAGALAKGGRLYIYEPLAATSDPPWPAWIADRVIGSILRILHWLAVAGRLYEPELAAAMRAGWTMQSPGEQPVRLDQLLDLFPPQLAILRVRPWHCWSIAYAVLCMSLRPAWQQRLERAAPLVYSLDRRFRATAWYPYLRSWPMVSILGEKR